MLKKCIIYTRVSTTMQEDNDSLKYQILKTQDYAISKVYNIKKVISDVDSGGKDDRIGFLELRNEIKKKSFDVLIVFETSRISRNTRTLLNFVFELTKQDIKFVSTSQPELDTTNPTGMLFFQVQSGLAEYERKQISIRTKSNKLARAKDGNWQGGNLPFGYKKDKDNNIAIDEENAEILREMFLDYIEFQSLKKVSEKYQRNISSIKFMLTNKFYIGKLPYGKQTNNLDTNTYKRKKEFEHFFDGRHPSIIDSEIFETVQNLIAKRRIKKTNGLLFSGVLKCKCGGKMYKTSTRGYVDYKCNICKKSVNSSKVESKIIRKILKIAELKKLNNSSDIDNILKLQGKINIINKKVNKFQEEKSKLIDLLTKDLITEEEFKLSKKKIDDNINFELINVKKYNSMIAFEEKKDNQKDNLEILESVVRNVKDEDIDELNDIFRMLIDEVILLDRKKMSLEIRLRI